MPCLGTMTNNFLSGPIIGIVQVLSATDWMLMFLPPKFTCWNPISDVKVSERGRTRRWLGHEGGGLVNGISVLKEEPPRAALPLLTWKDPERRRSSVNQEANSQQTWSLLEPRPWTPQPLALGATKVCCWSRSTQGTLLWLPEQTRTVTGSSPKSPPSLESARQYRARLPRMPLASFSFSWLRPDLANIHAPDRIISPEHHANHISPWWRLYLGLLLHHGPIF